MRRKPVLAFLATAGMAIGWSGSSFAAPCQVLPAGVTVDAGSLTDGTASVTAVHIYLQRSGSMAGYFSGAATSGAIFNPYKALLEQLPDLLGQLNARQEDLQQCRTRRAPLGGDGLSGLQDARAESFYECSGSAGHLVGSDGGPCITQQTHLDAVFAEASNRPSQDLSVVLTNLFLDDDSVNDEGSGAIRLPLLQILQSGKSIGVFGLKAPFSGYVYNVPFPNEQERYFFSGKHPIYMVLIGPAAVIQDFYKNILIPYYGDSLQNYGYVYGDDYNFTLFSSDMAAVSALDKTQTWQLPRRNFDPVDFIPDAMPRSGVLSGDPISVTLKGDFTQYSAMQPTLTVSTSETRVWLQPQSAVAGDRASCTPERWHAIADAAEKINPPLDQVLPITGGTAQILSGTEAAKFPRGYYFISVPIEIQANSSISMPGWLKDWGFSDNDISTELNPDNRFFRTYNLYDFVRSLPNIMIMTAKPQVVDYINFVIEKEN